MSNEDTDKTEQRGFVRFGASAPRTGPSLAGKPAERRKAIEAMFPELSSSSKKSDDGEG